MSERFECQPLSASPKIKNRIFGDIFILPGLQSGVFIGSTVHFCDDFVVIRRIANHRDSGVVFGGGSEQSDAADVDILNCIVNCDIGLCDCLDEWVQIADNDSDQLDVLLS
jgi:hypothetical protein